MSEIFIIARKGKLNPYALQDALIEAYASMASAEEAKLELQRKAWEEQKELSDHYFIVRLEVRDD